MIVGTLRFLFRFHLFIYFASFDVLKWIISITHDWHLDLVKFCYKKKKAFIYLYIIK